MDIEEMIKENNKTTAQFLGAATAAAKVGAQYAISFPGNIFKCRKELKESGEEFKFSDVLSKAHKTTADKIDFEKDYDNFYNKILGFLNKPNETQKQLMKANGIDEQAIITGIKHYSNQIRYSRVGQTVENSIRVLAQKVNDKLEKIAESDSKTKPSKFEEDLKKNVPTYEEQKEFADKVNKKLEQQLTNEELSKEDDNIK